MFAFNVKGKEYKIAYAYKYVAKSSVLSKIVALDSLKDEDNVSELLSVVMDTLPTLVLAGLQKHHDDFKCNYGSPEDIEKKLDMVMDLIDEYSEEDDAIGMVELFEKLTEELTESGFLSGKGKQKGKSQKKA